jgi:tripartite-type tricarboxylate transporter receptor subunit TctC
MDTKVQIGNRLNSLGQLGMRRIKTLACALFLSTACGALAQTYPSKPITILCGQPAGGGPDIMARVFAESMSKNMGQRVLVVNRTGAGGIIAAQALTQAPPDGYTLMLVLGAMHTILAAMQPLPFDAIKDFEFISLLHASSGVMLISAKDPARNLGEFLAFARSNPGGVNYGSPAIGSPAHLMGALLSTSAGAPMTHVPYKVGTQAMLEVVSGLLHTTFASSLLALPQVAQGQLRALAVGSPARLQALPDVPTLQELGYGDAAVESWFGMAAPKGTPADIIARIGSELSRAARDPAVMKRADADGLTLRTGSREEIQKLLVSDSERLGQAVRRLKIKAE